MSDLLRNIHFFLQSLSWRDGLDVLVVAFLLYQLLKLIRGTQAVQLLLGLGVIFAVGWAAQLLHLRLLEFIFNNGTQAIVIAAIVLFQPELRRALDQVGRLGTVRAVLGRQPELAYARTVDEVLRAAGSLSEHKVGALIVFERETGLENLAATGVHVNGDVTAEMLATIFIPGSPLHDGAVIIRESRIIAAGCVLPLAETLPGVAGWHPASRGARADHAERCGGAHRERGDRPDQRRARRQDLPRPRPGEAPRDAGHPARDRGCVGTLGDAPSAAASGTLRTLRRCSHP